jgi:hypothetical protein
MDLVGETAFEFSGKVAPVRVDPDALVRIAGHLADLSAEISREVPTSSGLTASPPGWSVTYALVRLNHAVNGHLIELSTHLSRLGVGIRTAGLDYTTADSFGATRMPGSAGQLGATDRGGR